MTRRQSIVDGNHAAAGVDVDGSRFRSDAAEQRRKEALAKLEAYGEYVC